MIKNKKVLFLYLILLIYIPILAIIIVNNFTRNFNSLINPIIWGTLFLITILMTLDEKYRVKKKKDKLKSIIIVIMFYYIIYFTLGLIFGFSLSPYSMKLLDITRNVLTFGIVIFFTEYFRITLIKFSKMKLSTFALISILIFLTNIEVFLIIKNSVNTEVLFKNSFEFLIPMLANSFLLTYLSHKGGFWSSFTFSFSLTLILLITPIFPSLNWFISFSLKMILVVAVAISFTLYERNRFKNETKKEKKGSLITNLLLILFVSVFSLFVVGVFKYMPIAVMSNSMFPVFERGDVIFVERIKDIEKVQESSIIKYKLGNSFIVHRVEKIIEKDGEKFFVTKGDNNNAIDLELVKEEQVYGIVHNKIKYIGYPSVWISEVLRKPIPDIEM